MRPYIFAPLLFSALTLLPSHASALVGSTPTTSFGMVGQIVGGVDGILVAPNWVLTAGHAATTGKLFSSGDGEAMIDAQFVLPGYHFPGNDLALLHLSTPIEADSYTAVNLSYIDSDNLAQYDTVTLANASGNGNGRYVESTLIRSTARAAHYVVHWIIADSSPSDSAILQGGDSGSGIFLGAADSDNPVLGGIASAICNTNKSCYVQPSAYHDLLDITMLLYVPDNPDELRHQRINWVTTTVSGNNTLDIGTDNISAVPEPNTWALLAISLPILLIRLRKPKT